MKKTIAMISMMVVSGMTVASDYVVIVTENFNTISDVVTPPEPVETYIGLPKIQTGYTNEYGRVMASSEYNHHGDYYPANKVMNGLNTNDHLTNWLAEYNVITNQWTGFEFNEPRKVKEFLVQRSEKYNCGTGKNVFLEYSDNGSSWNKASNDFVLDNKISGDQKIETTETGLHKFWRLYILDNYRDGGTCSASSYFIAIGEMDIIFKE